MEVVIAGVVGMVVGWSLSKVDTARSTLKREGYGPNLRRRVRVQITRDVNGRVIKVDRLGYTNCATCSATINSVDRTDLVQDGWRWSEVYQGWRCDGCIMEVGE